MQQRKSKLNPKAQSFVPTQALIKQVVKAVAGQVAPQKYADNAKISTSRQKKTKAMTNAIKRTDKELFMQPDTAKFDMVYLDPFLQGPASLPVPPLLSHQNVRCTSSGRGQTNANGNGWVVVRPAELPASDGVPISFSTGLNSDSISPLAVGSASAATNSPYTYADFKYGEDPTKVYRLVAVGLRARFLGSTFNAAGVCYTCEVESKTNETSLTGFDVTDIKNQPSWKEYTFRDRSWHSITRHIQSQADFRYVTNVDGTGWEYADTVGAGVLTQDTQFNMGMYFSMGPSQAFEWEVSCHFEAVGPNLPTRRVVKYDEPKVQTMVSEAKRRRFKDSTTKDHAVGIQPEQSGGFLDFLKSAADVVVPLIPSLLSLL